MRMLRIALVLALACGSIALPRAQDRASGAAGAVEHVTVHGRSLEGNLEGDSPDRDVLIYLPPAYHADPSRRFPVVYLLHGYGGHENAFTSQLATLQASGDRLAASAGFHQAIYVMPGAYTLHKGSMSSESPTTGNWETFVAEDLVAYVDTHYRTIAARASRGLGGHSMGGYGAIKIGMHRPDVFSALYLMSACCLTASRNPSAQAMAAAGAITTHEQAEAAANARGFGVSTTLAEAAAWSPNPSRPPLFLDLPIEHGTLRPEIVAKWVANAPLEIVPQYAGNLRKYPAIAMDVGRQDSLLRSNQQLHERLSGLGVTHVYEEYDGNHTNHITDRIEQRVLPFFSRHLAAK